MKSETWCQSLATWEGLGFPKGSQNRPSPCLGCVLQRESHNRECSNVWASGTGQQGRLPWGSELPECGLEGSGYPCGKDLYSVTLKYSCLLPSCVCVDLKLCVLCSPLFNFIPKAPASSAATSSWVNFRTEVTLYWADLQQIYQTD